MYRQVFVASLNWPNCVRILMDPTLRRAETIWCKEAGLLARALFRRRLRSIPDHSFVLMGGMNFADSRAATIVELAAICYAHEQDRYLRRFLQQALAESVFASVVLVQDHMVMSGELGGSACVLVPFTPFLPALRGRYQTGQRMITWGFGQRRIARSLRRVASECLRTLRATGWAAAGLVSKSSRPSGPAAVSVLNFRGGASWDHRHDLAWLVSPEPGHPIVFEYAHLRYPLSQTFVAELAQRGIRVVETHSRRRHLRGSEVWHPGAVYLAGAAKALPALLKTLVSALWSRQWLAVWRACQEWQFRMMVNARLDYYQRYNVRAEFIAGFTRAEAAGSCALAQIGGVSCVAQYSTWTDHFGSHTSTATFHLYFGAAIKSWGLPFLADFGLLNGYVFKTALANGHGPVAFLREQLARAGVRRSVCFLDEGFAHQDVAQCSLAVYEYLMKWVLDDETCGIVVKPKKNDSLLMLQRCFGDLYSAAIATGRMVVLDWSHYAAQAARSADLTIGVMGTAPFECAVMGCRTIYLNPFGYVPPFMSAIAHNVYATADDVIAAIEHLFRTEGETGIGVHPEEFLRSIDYHRDGDSCHRVQYLLMTYLSLVQRGKTRQVAIEETIKGFAERWSLAYV